MKLGSFLFFLISCALRVPYLESGGGKLRFIYCGSLGLGYGAAGRCDTLGCFKYFLYFGGTLGLIKVGYALLGTAP